MNVEANITIQSMWLIITISWLRLHCALDVYYDTVSILSHCYRVCPFHDHDGDVDKPSLQPCFYLVS